MGSVDGLVRGLVVSFRLGKLIKMDFFFFEDFGDSDDFECVEGT